MLTEWFNSIIVDLNHSYIVWAIIGLAFLMLINKKPKRKSIHAKYIEGSYDVLGSLRKIGTWQQQLAYLRKTHHTVFEELLLTGLSESGFKVKRNKRYTWDGGIDGRLYMPDSGLEVLIQAKRYKNKITTKHVSNFVHVCRRRKCAGLFIHTGTTPKEAWHEARAGGILIISGPKLIEFIHQPKSILIDVSPTLGAFPKTHS